MIQRWIEELRDRRESDPKVDDFIAEVAEVYRKHGMSISHEDGHGSFRIENFNEANITWLNEASDARRLGRF